ncbi:patatin-like phospholipase family protein [Gaoshiqia sp. Z1-71]|uniref:patatin-like phospholipase family protein n=1 Tax=Gaoshiqia hydrogeniformans TaxID=3290090 RepID=UPI003BF80268
MAAQFRNLIFEGGGVKGIAYIGAMQILEQRGMLFPIKRAGGTSAGAINALIFSLGYNIREQLEIMESTNFKEFMDNSFGLIRDIRRLAKDFGWNKGDFFTKWIGNLIEKKLGSRDATFGDLKAAGLPDLYVIGTNLSTGFAEVFSAERHAGMPLHKAVRISMAIPLFFAAVRHGDRDDVYVDGGVMQNFPIKLFDRERYIDMDDESGAARKTEYYNRENAKLSLSNPGRSPYVYNRQTLGLRLDSQKLIAAFRYNEPLEGKPIKNFTDYAKGLMNAIMQVQENQHLYGDDWQRTIYINTLDVKATDFKLTDEKKKALLIQGIDGAENYFSWFDNPDEHPVNRV